MYFILTCTCNNSFYNMIDSSLIIAHRQISFLAFCAVHTADLAHVVLLCSTYACNVHLSLVVTP